MLISNQLRVIFVQDQKTTGNQQQTKKYQELFFFSCPENISV